MERIDSYRHTMHAVLVLLTLFFYGIRSEARFRENYTEQHPLIVTCDWEMPPYEFLDDQGTPSGYTVELISTILKAMDVPYRFVMKENPLAADSLKRQHGLKLVSTVLFNDQDCYLSRNIVYYYRFQMASRKDAPPINSLDNLSEDKMLIFRLDGRFSQTAFRDLHTRAHVEFHAPMEALSGISSGKYDYFVWGEEPLKWKIRELNLENLRLNDINAPLVEVRFGSTDNQLIDAIDDQYARLDQSGDIELLRDKWFHPERHHDNASPIVLYAAIAVAAIVLLLFLLNRLVSRSVRRKTLKNSEQSRIMNLALDMGGYMVSEYTPRADRFKNVRGDLMDESLTMGDAMGQLHKDDLKDFMDMVSRLKDQEATSAELQVRRNAGTADNPLWQFMSGSCIRERDEEDHTAYLLVAKDITKDMDEQHENDEMATKFLKAFDISLIAMSFYDADGRLLDMNEQMKKVVGADESNQQFFYETPLFEAPLFKEVLSPGMKEVTHACQRMYYPEIGLDKYLEYRIRPVFTDEGVVRYYAVTVRDITAERNLYREQQITQRQLKVTSDEVLKFENQLNYLLSNCNMFIWRSNYERRTIEIGRSLHKVDHTLTFDDYLDSVTEDEQRKANESFFNPLMKNRPINFIRHYELSLLTKRESWFAITGTPEYDKNGHPIGHFGTIRDVTQLMRSQEELRQETARAEQSGALKATFLANMTHEIRTPLNAIVGFSDLLHMATTAEERREFIGIISHNCDLLLRLIDDILETSSMGRSLQSFELEDIDFAKYFDELCQTVAQRVQNPAVTFVKDNPYDTFPARTDKERIQQVVTNFVTNAVKYTKEGHIKVGYREEWRENSGERIDGIYIYCEDTGAGIPKSKQASVFDRFVKLNDYVQGTGLGLSICKAIADRCGGRIGVMSEGDGKGSTFWLWIPRYLTSSNLTSEK